MISAFISAISGIDELRKSPAGYSDRLPGAFGLGTFCDFGEGGLYDDMARDAGGLDSSEMGFVAMAICEARPTSAALRFFSFSSSTFLRTCSLLMDVVMGWESSVIEYLGLNVGGLGGA